MYYSYVEIEYVATRFSPARTDLALKLLTPFWGAPVFEVSGDKKGGSVRPHSSIIIDHSYKIM